MSSEYLVRHRGRVRGPVSLERLRELHDAGTLPLDVELAEAGTELFYPLASLSYLFQAPPAASPRPRTPAVATPSRVSSAQPVARSRPDRDDQEEDERPAFRRKPAAFGAALACAVLAAAGITIAALLQNWVVIERSEKIDDLGEVVIRVECGLFQIKPEIRTGSMPLDPLLRAFFQEMSGPRPFSDLKMVVSDPDAVAAPVSLGQVNQTRMLGIVIPVLLGLGSLATIIAAALAQSQNRVPSGMASGAVLAGILGIACIVAFRFLGIFIDAHEFEDADLLVGAPFVVANISGLLLILAGILLAQGHRLARASSIPGRGRRRF